MLQNQVFKQRLALIPLSLLIFIATFVSGVFVHGIFQSRECVQVGEDMGRETKFEGNKITSGACFMKTEDGQWAPLENWSVD